MNSFETSLACLTANGPPRVWSFAVTIFGVLGQKAGTEISGLLLNHIMAEAGIKPEACRVALHRLKKDGWLEVRKAGRLSHYSLSASGRTQTAAASPRIYHTRPAPDAAWITILPRGTAPAQDCVTLGPSVWLTTARPSEAEAFATPVPADAVLPDWILDKVFDPRTTALCAQTVERFRALSETLGPAPDLTPMQRMILNALVVHGWRRIVLRVPELPDGITAQATAFVACRSAALALIDRLAPPSLERLEAARVDAAGA